MSPLNSRLFPPAIFFFCPSMKIPCGLFHSRLGERILVPSNSWLLSEQLGQLLPDLSVLTLNAHDFRYPRKSVGLTIVSKSQAHNEIAEQ